MATDAPITGAQTRAPETNPQQDLLLSRIRDIQVAAELIDALILAVDVMLQDQRRIMRDQGAGSFLIDNELWDGAATLFATVRERATAIGKLGEAIEVAELRAPDAPAAA